MDIRTKLVFALVAVSLASMLALGAFTYDVVRGMFRDIAFRQLEAVAETKKQDLEKVVAGWRDRVQLITSRTKLRETLTDVAAHGVEPEAAAVVARILADAVEAVESLRGITIYGASGYRVATAGEDAGAVERMRPSAFWLADAPVVFENVSFDADGRMTVVFIAPIRRDGRLIGGAQVVLSAQELVDVTRDYTGLGETGETLIARRTEDGGALILNALRHDPEAGIRRKIPADGEADPTLHAVHGRESLFREGARDYRGREVWAATRHLGDFDWGLVVKVDADEETQPVLALRATFWRLAVSLSAFAILVGAGLGFYFARPIRQLAEVAQRIREGEYDVRARTDSDDEVALLARTFNEMTAELIEKHRDLERRIGGRAP